MPTIGPALLPTGSGQAPTRLLSHDAETVGRAQTRPCRGAATEGVLARQPVLVAYLQECQKRISTAQDEGMGPLVSIRAFSDGYQGESIEHSLMDPEREGGEQNAQKYVRLETHMLALRV